ncbi:Retrovirus-related Pol polyprotein from transposon TNT 1-94 [Dendrobium catenatum]|uniref:Retrovirus-related Pol polyprotein from transposon TNT 1-94 n=1 Tax=Dendrobium catenatum TaxID=906689 RepID=A0A2I0WFE8_9ASPA|nr:Retrovirus-related Pol polyprotein from transposon TNT 1-94 [Dendrobium catenatum]
MADQESAISPTSAPGSHSSATSNYIAPAPLKFLISNLKTLVPNSLSSENYHIWCIQILQHFSANGFADFLIGVTSCPSDQSSEAFFKWSLIDRILISALLSTISHAILPYVLTPSTAHDVWQILERRMQPNIRSRVIQLKNELHNIKMNNSTMQQYLMQIKNQVDNIALSGSQIDTEDILIYILNGLPSTYNSFNTSIRTSLHPIDLDTLYSLLCSEEITMQREHQKEVGANLDNSAFYTSRTGLNRGNGSNHNFNNQKLDSRSTSDYSSPSQPNQPTSKIACPTCQICGKPGHIALNCWHRNNPKYAPSTPPNQRALLSQQTPASIKDWILDSGASSHLDFSNLHHGSSYQGPDTISTANNASLPIQHSGQGLLPLPDSARWSGSPPTSSWSTT